MFICDLSLVIRHMGRDTIRLISYGAEMNEKIWKYFGYWAMTLFLFVATLLIVHWTRGSIPWDKLDSGWIQAIGSIAAILFAIVIGERQAANALTTVREADHLSARRKYDSIIALAESTETFMSAISNCFSDGKMGYLHFRGAYRKAAFDSLADAVNAVSAQDLGSYNSIVSWTLLREAVVNFQGNMTRVQTFISGQRTDGGVNQVLDYDSTAIKLCHSQVQKTIAVLRDHRPAFAT